MTFRSRGPAGLPRSRVMLPVLVWRLRPLWLAAGLIAALVIVVAVLTGVATDYLWFRATGFGRVTPTIVAGLSTTVWILIR